MANFFHIGQRVKLVKPRLQKNMGLEGTISWFGHITHPYMEWEHLVLVPIGPCNCVVTFDSIGPRPTHTDCLEPILPDGLESPEEIKELYTPEEECVYVHS